MNRQERIDELLSGGVERLTDAELDELMRLNNVDVDEGMSRLYLKCIEIVAKNPDNQLARDFMRQREEKLQKRYEQS